MSKGYRNKTARTDKSYQEIFEPNLIAIEGWTREGLTGPEIAARLGVSENTFYKYKNLYEPIKEALREGKIIADYRVENALFKRAIGYTTEEFVFEMAGAESQQAARHRSTPGASQDVSLTEEQWEMSQEFFQDTCCYCGKTGEKLTKDHFIPLTKGGAYAVYNILPACSTCNSSKSNSDPVDWYKKQSFFSEQRFQRINDYLKLMDLQRTSTASTMAPDSHLIITKKVVKEVPPNVNAAVFWLKNRRPDIWKDKQETTVDFNNITIIEDLQPDTPEGDSNG